MTLDELLNNGPEPGTAAAEPVSPESPAGGQPPAESPRESEPPTRLPAAPAPDEPPPDATTPEPIPAPPVLDEPPPAAVRPSRLRLLLVAGVAAPGGMVLLGTLLAWLLRREPLLAGLSLVQPWPRTLLWALLGMAVSLGGTTGLSAVWKRFGDELEKASLDTGDEVLRVAGWPVLAVVVATAGLGEEVLFRGALQPTLGLPLASLAFGLAHGGWRIREMWCYVLAATLAGLTFGLLYQYTGSLWAAVLAHAGHNLLVTFYLLQRRRQKARS